MLYRLLDPVRLLRCCACGIIFQIVVETEARPSLTPNRWPMLRKTFARGLAKNLFTRMRDETRRDEQTVECVAERDRVALRLSGEI